MPTACAPLVFQTARGEARMQRTYAMTARFEDATASRSSSMSDQSSSKAPSVEKRSLKEKLESANAFIQDYYDRRAQARMLAENPDSVLAQQITPPTFRSRYADPNHSTNKHLFNLVTGGKANARTLGEAHRQRHRQKINEERIARSLPPIEGPTGPVGVVVRCVKKVLVEDILYLMVVNLPSEEELAAARQTLLENGWRS
ncbi:hypothetical protein VTN77DRAFT_4961 [Rasamsonia byssochlamydoides]|uniref:uncharacterized protein n=1 Tax=Rasamsonia byssochlamydoides TaxID=89139 RepID=UPI0037432232